MKCMLISVLFILNNSVDTYSQSLMELIPELSSSIEWDEGSITSNLSKTEARAAIEKLNRDYAEAQIRTVHKLEPRGANHAYGILMMDSYKKIRVFYLCKRHDDGQYRVIKIRVSGF